MYLTDHMLLKCIQFILLLLLVSPQTLCYSQENQRNEKGKQEGYWIVYGKEKPEKGHCDSCKVEEGKYINGRKEGIWVKYHPDGITPRLKANYVGGRPNGEYEKIHPNGITKEKGNFHAQTLRGPFIIMNEEGVVTQEKTFNTDGLVEGVERYFYDDGTLQMEVTKINGLATGVSKTYYPNGDLKKEISFGVDGEVISAIEKERVNPPFDSVNDKGSGGPDGRDGIIKDGSKYSRDGYNKLYNNADELWMNGIFKSGKLWDGELYKYDSDGILLKIEIWKNGKYYSDGHLE